MDIHGYPRKNDMDMDMDMDGIFLIHGKPVNSLYWSAMGDRYSFVFNYSPYKKPFVSLYSCYNQLIWKTIPYGEDCQLKSPGTFGLDEYSNLFVTDYQSHYICVYSYRREFLLRFDKEEIRKRIYSTKKHLNLPSRKDYSYL